MKPSAAWQDVGGVDGVQLVDTRIQLHWAVQLAAAYGTTLSDKKPDDSHTNLEWLAAHAILASNAHGGCRGALRFADLTLLLTRDDGTSLAERPLEGLAFDQALDWLSVQASQHAGAQKRLAPPLDPPPDHAVGSGGPFAADVAALRELSGWYAGADRLLRAFAAEETNASPVRCWPHHFDIATLLTLEPGKSGEAARTVGVGMTPGDEGYPEPYFYVTPWPYPKAPAPPGLEAGHWHREGWFGAVLTRAELLRGTGSQGETLARFVSDAVGAARDLAGA